MEQNLNKNMNLEVLDLRSTIQVSESINSEFIFKIYPNYESAKEIFRTSIKNYKLSQETYTLEEFATEHIEIIKDLVNLYSHCLILETGFFIIFNYFD